MTPSFRGKYLPTNDIVSSHVTSKIDKQVDIINQLRQLLRTFLESTKDCDRCSRKIRAALFNQAEQDLALTLATKPLSEETGEKLD